jgi:hypothetical protein
MSFTFQTNDEELRNILLGAEYTEENWISENSAYYITENYLGSFWPRYVVKATCGGWCPINIRDSNPFKTLKGAIRYIEKHKERYKASA